MLPIHLPRYVIRPALSHVGDGLRGFDSDVAVWLVVGTIATESQFAALDQHTGAGDRTWGPAYGLGQMEQATADDIWDTFLASRPELAARVRDLLAPVPGRTHQLATNLSYAAAMIRLRYWRMRDCVLPVKADATAYARLWKRFYNTPAGKGTEAKFLADWQRLVAPFYTEDL